MKNLVKYCRIIIFGFLGYSCNLGVSPKLKMLSMFDQNLKESSSSFNITANVTGLVNGESLILSLNGIESLNISANGSFQFSTNLNYASSYNLQITSMPTGKNCNSSPATGVITSSINILVSCTDGNSNGPLVGGTIINTLNLSGNVTTVLNDNVLLTGINGITTDGQNLYVTAYDNHTIGKLNLSNNNYTIIAGQNGSSGNQDGIGTNAKFNGPAALVYINDSLYITDYGNNCIRKMVLSTGDVSTLATSQLYPYGITSDGTYLYYTSKYQVKKLKLQDNSVSDIAGHLSFSGYADGTGTTARFLPASGVLPGALTYHQGDIYVLDRGNCAVRKVVINTGDVTTVVGSPPPTSSCGTVDGIGTSAKIYDTDGLVSDGTNLYFAQSGNHIIRKITMSTMMVSLLAGTAGSNGLVDGFQASAKFKWPAIMTSDGTKLYVTDYGNNAIRKIE